MDITAPHNVMYSLTTRPASMSGLGDTLIAPWYTHPLHDTVSSLMSHLGSTPRYSVACSSPKAGIVLRVSCIHYIAMFPRQHHTSCCYSPLGAAPAAPTPPPKPALRTNPRARAPAHRTCTGTTIGPTPSGAYIRTAFPRSRYGRHPALAS